MRTTINLPDALGEAAKAMAHREGRTFTSVVEEGLRMVTSEVSDAGRAPVTLPESGDPNGRFLVDILDKEALWAALDADGIK